jgi:diphthamide biosynthesis protein 3
MGINDYDEIEIEDMEYDEEKSVYHYPCPCGLGGTSDKL